MTFSFSNIKLESEIFQLERKINNLQIQSSLIQEDIKKQDRMRTLLQKNLASINEQIILTEKGLVDKELVWNDQLFTQFDQYIRSLKEEQCYKVKLSSKIPSDRLFTRFSISKKDFLILKDQFILPQNKYRVSLIITPFYDFLTPENALPTIDELKDNTGETLTDLTCDSLQPLKDILLDIDNDNQIQNNTIYTINNVFLIAIHPIYIEDDSDILSIEIHSDAIRNHELTNYMIAGFIIHTEN